MAFGVCERRPSPQSWNISCEESNSRQQPLPSLWMTPSPALLPDGIRGRPCAGITPVVGDVLARWPRLPYYTYFTNNLDLFMPC
jgi:hypothetical protein